MPRRKAPTLYVVETGDDGERPVVRIVAGKRSRAIDEAERHLVERDLDLFQRSGFVVRVAPEEVDVGAGKKAEVLRIHAVGAQHMRERFTKAVDLQKYDSRTKKWVSVDCPKDFAEAYLERVGCWKLPPLRAVSTTPYLCYDGSVNTRPGYDPATGIYLDTRGIVFPALPPAPTRAEALAALDRLDCVLGTLDIVDDVSRSVALSALMTPILRGAMSAAPLHGITAPVAGSGKTKVVHIAAILATGHWAPMTALGQNEEETEKRIGAVMRAGDVICALDNATRPIGGEFLCQAITEPLVAPRILGSSSRSMIPNTIVFFATGNNVEDALQKIGMGGVEAVAFDASSDDPAELTDFILGKIGAVRKAQADAARATIAAIDQMLVNREEAQALAAMERVAGTLDRFADRHASLRGAHRAAYERLLGAVATLHARTVWAATRRAGKYWNFDVYQYLGDGAAAEAKVRSGEAIAGLTAVIESDQGNPELASAHDLLAQILANAEQWEMDFVNAARHHAVAVYQEPLSRAQDVWDACEAPYGTGQGYYRDGVAATLRKWFEEHVELREELERRVTRAWTTSVIAPLRRAAGLGGPAAADMVAE
jgi:hypothetical protein